MMLSGFHNGKSVGACLTAFYCEPACADIGVFYVGGFYRSEEHTAELQSQR